MSFPIDLMTQTLEFTDGERSNKFYNLTLLINSTGMCLLIRRWGKVGAGGEIKTEKFAIRAKAETEYEKLIASKKAKGYETKRQDIKLIADESQLRMAIGPGIWPKIPGPAIEHIIPGADVSSRPTTNQPTRFDEDGNYIGEPAARTFSQTEIKRARQAQAVLDQEEAVKTYAQNPNFGRF